MGQFWETLITPDAIIIPIMVGVVAFWAMYCFLKQKRDRLIDQIVVAPGVDTCTFITVGGHQSHVFYDIDKLSGSLEYLEGIDKWYIDNVNEIRQKRGADYLAFIERQDGPVGAIVTKDKLSSALRIPSLIVRPKRRITASVLKGTSGDSTRGKKIIIVTDVTTTGQAVDRVLEILEGFGAAVVGVVTIVNRGGEKTKNHFKEKSIEFRYAEDNLDRFLPQQEAR